MFQGTQYLMKWTNYHKQESTWEPASHLPNKLTSTFLAPDVSPIGLQQAADSSESAILQRLCSRQTRVVVKDRTTWVNFQCVSIGIINWINMTKVYVCFLMRITRRLYNKHVFDRQNSEVVKVLSSCGETGYHLCNSTFCLVWFSVCDKRKLGELIFILYKFCISDAAYHELASAYCELPRNRHIVQERAAIDSMFQIEHCPGNISGVYDSVTNEISSFTRNNSLLNDKPLKIKVAGDGTRVSRISSFVTLSMSFPESDKDVNKDTLKTLAILKCKENYEMLSVCSSSVIRELNELIKKTYIDCLWKGIRNRRVLW